MTTNIIIRTVGWPVEIETIDGSGSSAISNETVVPAWSEATTYITQTRSVVLTERAGDPEPQPESGK